MVKANRRAATASWFSTRLELVRRTERNHEIRSRDEVSAWPIWAALESRLAELGATISAAQAEVDVYFAHPARDFARTDEALRIRRKGGRTFITYKGPKIDADHENPPRDRPAAAARRRDGPGMDRAAGSLGVHRGGRSAEIAPQGPVVWQGRSVEASLDEVERLGTFAELELVVEPDDVEAAKACIASLAEALGLEGSERRSYLELLMDSGVMKRRDCNV